jgi:hypothetical protein
MLGSKKTSVDPATKAGRYAALHAALETGEMSITDILDAAKQVAEARADREQEASSPAPQPAPAFASQPSVYVSRSGHSLSFAYGKDVTFDDVIAAVKRLESAQPDSPQRQPARESAAKPPSAFDLRRSFARTSAEPLIDEPWRDQTTEGPADLIRHFAAVAVSEHWSEITLHDEKTWSLIMDVAEFATDVAVRLAGVSETWADEYRALVAGPRK